MLLIPPRDVGAEISHKLIRRGECIRGFGRADVPVMPLPTLVVVAQHALASHHVGESVLETML